MAHEKKKSSTGNWEREMRQAPEGGSSEFRQKKGRTPPGMAPLVTPKKKD